VKKTEDNIIASNRKARHDFHIDETFETGIVLVGTEVKSMRAHKVNLKDSYAGVKGGEVFLYNMHVSPYDKGTTAAHEPERPRKLLLHRQEIRRLIGKTKERGLTLVPLKLYFSGSKVKVELGLARGKQLHDKRKAMAERDAKREIDRAFRERQKE
jgi:SsrA-binding protein